MTLDHERLDVYQVSLDFAVWSYEQVKHLSGVDRHARDQILRASQSITLNIAEGAASSRHPSGAGFFRLPGDRHVSVALFSIFSSGARESRRRNGRWAKISSSGSSPCGHG